MRWGFYHALNIKKIKGVKLIAICDKEPKNTFIHLNEEIKKLPLYKDFDEMIKKEKLDAVILALPHPLHFPVTIECLKSGLNVYVEKPIANTTYEAERMIEEAEKRKKILMVGHNRRFEGYVRKLKKIIKKQEIVGVEIKFAGLKSKDYFKFEWKRKKGGGPLLTNFIHDIDDLRFILGEVRKVGAFISNRIRKFEMEDTSVGIMEIEGGIPVSFFISDTVVNPINYSHIFYGIKETYAIPELVKFKFKKSGEIISKKINYKKTNSLLLCEKEFFSAIRENRIPDPSPYEAYRNLKIIEALEESFEKKKIIEI